MEEKIIGIADGLDYKESFLVGQKRYAAIFTNERIIFLARPGYVASKFGIASFLANKAADMVMGQRIEDMTLSEVLNSDYEKIILEKSDLSSLELHSAIVLFRGKITFDKDGRQFKFTLDKKAKLDQFKRLLTMMG